jgi:hypothetical protein
MEQAYTGLGYIFLKFENEVPKPEKRKITEEIVKMGNGHIQAVEFPKGWIFYNSRVYDAAARFETSNEQRVHELLNGIGKIKDIKTDYLCVRYVIKSKPFIRFKELEQL